MARRSLPITETIHPDRPDLDRLPAKDVVRRILLEDARALDSLHRACAPIAHAAEAIARAVRGRGRLFYVGAGTSGRVGALDAAEWQPTFGIPRGRVRVILAGGRAALGRAVEGAEDSREDGAGAMKKARIRPQDVVCGITASGRTPFVIGAMGAAGRGVRVLITADAHAPIPCDIRIPLDTGPELISGSTRMKAGLATHAVLQAMSTTAAVLAGRVHGTHMVGVRATNRKLRARARRILEEVAGVPPSRSASLLRRAGGEVDVAIVMAIRGDAPRSARAALRSAGSLRAVLEEEG
jgi:N-acetylmuramic acid 6-phosphate etherase